MTMTSPLPRVLRAGIGRPLTLREHEATFAGASSPVTLFDELEASGLTGRGGAAFATSRKVDLLRTQRHRHKGVVINAMEGEPVGHKDRTLLSTNPHLVLDGATYLASLIGARQIDICVSRGEPTIIRHVQRAIHERQSRGTGPTIVLQTPPWRYVAGEESALVHWLNDNETMPQYRPHRPNVLHVGRTPVLVVNAETSAQVGLIGHYGAAWFREVGTPTSPGTTLVSISGAVERRMVHEVVLGTPLRTILRDARAETEIQAVLTGGYGGAWLGGEHLDVAYCDEELRPLGASVGAGILVVLPTGACGLAETHRIVAWMANESSRQCGPCAFGLPALAEDLNLLKLGSREPREVLVRLQERCAVIEGRGACRHPDGVVRLVESALSVFKDDIERHVSGSPCSLEGSPRHWVTVPAMVHESELVWE
jgi:NADH:ubiquinone oxidoreductase subunit F (NADH-binding)